MLSLGRQDEFDLEEMSFADADVDAGRRLFLGEDGANRACSFCHDNAGANHADNRLNENFDTGAHGLDPSLPPDDGFGNPGDGTFNTVSLVEAADTPPFFHNNSAATLEEAVEFYTTDLREFATAALAARSTSLSVRSSRWQRSCGPSMRSTTPNRLAVANDARRMRDKRTLSRSEGGRVGHPGRDRCAHESDLAADAARNSSCAGLNREAIEARNRGRRTRDQGASADVARNSGADRGGGSPWRTAAEWVTRRGRHDLRTISASAQRLIGRSPVTGATW